ncbi:hypothetical protein [Enterovibrio norvegicus]|uniref:Uncharacterized protein n=1 Tax=Enterovibrio norvegicus TaxID=188144 RepID=A0A2N7LBP5_9GAMM|nr:hypothetical protein [Enterovibrio norvegicus]MCC4798371.1 hypothetical protein [Enterovibrio norvegicus]PMH65301.1 hypothetical protein BCU62_13355 [Enterovibrio norvegicus]PMI33192.1 hypothetical protein BCU46_03695 [Enterovibrio norvegicus]PMI33601.1 hypothetical protein BCU47_09155 [Enterovibrio norvegicus]PMN48257.1 hypothetical protein BCT30_02440 [Enterovibrio norvegicus]
MRNQIPCPDCHVSIHFDLNLLLAGRAFSCPRCRASISLHPASQPQLSKAVDGFAELQKLNDKANAASANALGEQ